MAANAAQGVLRSRLGQEITLQSLDYGQQIVHNGVTSSLHPAGHVLGSAQVRLAHGGKTWVASGDYKVAPDATCTPFEPVRCDVFITESTFGLPIYRWRADAEIFADINSWWARNAAQGRASVMCCYSFGKAQRILSGIDAPLVPRRATQHRLTGAGVVCYTLTVVRSGSCRLKRALVLCPQPAGAPCQTLWRFRDAVAMAGEMRCARRRAATQGVCAHDHADWRASCAAIAHPRPAVTSPTAACRCWCFT